LKAKRLFISSLAVVLAAIGASQISAREQQNQEQQKEMHADMDSIFGRRPILLVPGWWGHLEDLLPLHQRFVRDGWESEEVMALEFVDPVGSSVDHALEMETALKQLLDRTGAEEVDVVAHSMGSLAVWFYLQTRGNPLGIRRVAFLAAPFQGTVTAHLAWGEGGREMIPGSEFLKKLQSGPPPQQWVEVLTVRTPLDLTVVPWEGSTLLQGRDRLICCPTHQGLLDHEETFAVIRNFLTRGWGQEEADLRQGHKRP
jgi:triacylglycerol lipase